MIKRIFSLFLLFVLWCGIAHSAEFGSVRAEGMGGAFAAVDGDSGAVYHNPAGIAGITIPEVSVNAGYFRDASWDGSIVGMIYAWPWRILGASTLALHRDTQMGGSDYTRQAGMTFAWSQDEEKGQLRWGATFKWREDTRRWMQSGLVDLGLQKEWKEEKLTLGLCVTNLLSDDQDAAGLIPSCGILYRAPVGNIVADINWRTDGPYLRCGLEHSFYNDLLVLRGGYMGAPEALFTLGASSYFRPFGFDVSFSWPAASMSGTGYFRLAAQYRFGGERFSERFMERKTHLEEMERLKKAYTVEKVKRVQEEAGYRFPLKHKAVPGDTLRALAQKYYGNGNKWQLIYNVNIDRVERGQPRIGEELLIPAP